MVGLCIRRYWAYEIGAYEIGAYGNGLSIFYRSGHQKAKLGQVFDSRERDVSSDSTSRSHQPGTSNHGQLLTSRSARGTYFIPTRLPIRCRLDH